MNDDTRVAFLRLASELEKKIEYWRTLKEDPHGVATPVMVGLQEMQDAVWKIIKRNEPVDWHAEGAVPPSRESLWKAGEP